MRFYRFHGRNSSLTPLKQAKSFIYAVVGEHHYALKKALGQHYRFKLWTNFKHYLKSMIQGRSPFDFKLLFTTLKHVLF